MTPTWSDISKPMPPASVLRHSGWSFDLPVEGHSMEPLLQQGDTLTIRCLPIEAMQPGDLICFQRDQSLVAHRLIRIADARGRLYEKGDAECVGQWINGDCVVGRVDQINGKQTDPRTHKRALRVGRRETLIAGWLCRLHLLPLPIGLSTHWRNFKRAHLAPRDPR